MAVRRLTEAQAQRTASVVPGAGVWRANSTLSNCQTAEVQLNAVSTATHGTEVALAQRKPAHRCHSSSAAGQFHGPNRDGPTPRRALHCGLQPHASPGLAATEAVLPLQTSGGEADAAALLDRYTGLRRAVAELESVYEASQRSLEALPKPSSVQALQHAAHLKHTAADCAVRLCELQRHIIAILEGQAAVLGPFSPLPRHNEEPTEGHSIAQMHVDFPNSDDGAAFLARLQALEEELAALKAAGHGGSQARAGAASREPQLQPEEAEQQDRLDHTRSLAENWPESGQLLCDHTELVQPKNGPNLPGQEALKRPTIPCCSVAVQMDGPDAPAPHPTPAEEERWRHREAKWRRKKRGLKRQLEEAAAREEELVRYLGEVQEQLEVLRGCVQHDRAPAGDTGPDGATPVQTGTHLPGKWAACTQELKQVVAQISICLHPDRHLSLVDGSAEQARLEVAEQEGRESVAAAAETAAGFARAVPALLLAVQAQTVECARLRAEAAALAPRCAALQAAAAAAWQGAAVAVGREEAAGRRVLEGDWRLAVQMEEEVMRHASFSLLRMALVERVADLQQRAQEGKARETALVARAEELQRRCIAVEATLSWAVVGLQDAAGSAEECEQEAQWLLVALRHAATERQAQDLRVQQLAATWEAERTAAQCREMEARLSLQATRAAAEAARVEADQCRRRSDCLEIALSTATQSIAPLELTARAGAAAAHAMWREALELHHALLRSALSAPPCARPPPADAAVLDVPAVVALLEELQTALRRSERKRRALKQRLRAAAQTTLTHRKAVWLLYLRAREFALATAQAHSSQPSSPAITPSGAAPIVSSKGSPGRVSHRDRSAAPSSTSSPLLPPPQPALRPTVRGLPPHVLRGLLAKAGAAAPATPREVSRRFLGPPAACPGPGPGPAPRAASLPRRPPPRG